MNSYNDITRLRFFSFNFLAANMIHWNECIDNDILALKCNCKLTSNLLLIAINYHLSKLSTAIIVWIDHIDWLISFGSIDQWSNLEYLVNL